MIGKNELRFSREFVAAPEKSASARYCSFFFFGKCFFLYCINRFWLLFFSFFLVASHQHTEIRISSTHQKTKRLQCARQVSILSHPVGTRVFYH